ncbi:MAG: AraC family transcriptional regulator [Fusicatenibacter sp.]|nr:AraC family transcriptional regulator [Fusicatenibacter sp.]
MPYQIENRNSSFSSGHFSGLTTIPHLHTHLEMIYMAEGSSVATVDSENFLIEKGDLFLSFPNQVHYYHDRCPCSGYLIIFSHSLFQELKDLFLSNVPVSSVVKKEQLTPRIHLFLENITVKNNSGNSFDQIAAKGYLLALLGEVLPCIALKPNTSSMDSIRSILTYCSERYTEPLTLETLARNLHLSKYYISHIFTERMQISFPDFINSLRIEHACTMLEKDTNITEIAFSSGFSSVRTFNRAFSKYMHMTPREYMKQKETLPATLLVP